MKLSLLAVALAAPILVAADVENYIITLQKGVVQEYKQDPSKYKFENDAGVVLAEIERAFVFHNNVMIGVTADPSQIQLLEALPYVAVVEPDQSSVRLPENPNDFSASDFEEDESLLTFSAASAEASTASTSAPAPTITTQNVANLYHLDMLDQRDGGLNSLYQYASIGAGVHLYVLDDGVRGTHQEFSGRVGDGADFVGDGLGKSGGNVCGSHGTHVAAAAAGTTYGPGKGMIVHSVRVLDCNGSASGSTVLAGLEWIMNNAQFPAVVVASIGGEYSSAINNGFSQVMDAGIVAVTAAGNEGRDACITSPASTPGIICVGAIDSTYTRPSFSNFGNCVTLSAAGVNVRSASHKSDNASVRFSGTSVSAPIVAGIAGQYLSYFPDALPSDVYNAVSFIATPGVVTKSNGSPTKSAYGYGRDEALGDSSFNTTAPANNSSGGPVTASMGLTSLLAIASAFLL
eukprot:Clim_evm63s191 gene=Clim_evmTU63s191